MHPIDRRAFLEQASLAAAGLWRGGCATTTARRRAPRQILPDEKMRIGCIGIGGQGGGVMAELATFADVEIAALCDRPRREMAALRLAAQSGPRSGLR